MHLNIEIKARCEDTHRVKQILEKHNARFIGVDHQVDTYFRVDQGRLKLRVGQIENALIYYERADQAGPKQADVHLYKCAPDTALKEVLSAALGVKIIVDKMRHIYFIDHVKFHLDEVAGLGSFVEIEAIDEFGQIGKATLERQCEYYMNLLGVQKNALVDRSYADLVATNID